MHRKRRRKNGQPRTTDRSLHRVCKDSPKEPVFNATLFRLWMSGKTFSELVTMFAGTEHSFSAVHLFHSAKDYRWAERREDILTRMAKENDRQITLEKSRQMNVMSMILEMNAYNVERAYMDFAKNPREFFTEDNLKDKWYIAQNLDSFKSVIDYYRKLIRPEEMEDGTQNNVTPGIGNAIFVQTHSDVRDKIIEAMKKAADSRHLTSGDTAPIEVSAENKNTEDDK